MANKFKKRIKQFNVAPGTLNRLKTVFDKNHWKIDTETEISRYNNYAHFLSYLKGDEQELILDLTNRFVDIPFNAYFEIVANIMKAIIASNRGITTYYVAPLLKEDDLGDYTKSSLAVLRIFSGDSLSIRLGIKDIKFIPINNIKKKLVDNPVVLKANEKILVVDDFIGTGKTALEALDYLKGTTYSNEHIIILTIAILKIGYEQLKQHNYNIEYNIILTKGISDYYIDDVKTDNINKMLCIEKRLCNIRKNSKFSLGFNQSEALINMHKIPNNTFPIYWKQDGVSPYKREDYE